MFKRLLFFSATLVFSLVFSQKAAAQCSPTATEIPNNGIDEDCDGLDDVFLVLPPFAYAVVGQDMEIYFRNCILSQHPNDYVFEVNTALGGINSGKKWGFMPNSNQVGEHPLELKIKSQAGQILATASTIVRISPASPPADLSPKRLILYGHSFFDQGYLPKYVADLVAQPGNPPISFHGKKASWAAPFPKHEGYGGQMWRWFINDPTSPFRYGSDISLKKYFDDVCGPAQRPDWMVIHMDINDFCGYTALAGATLQEIDDSITNDWNKHAQRIIDSIRVAAPLCKLAICLSPMPNARQSAFDATYGGNPVLSNRWRWQKIISRLLFKNIERYGNRENENFWLLPEYLDLDDLDEYNPPDARHPDPADGNIMTHCGYMEIGKSIYAWLKYIENQPVTPVLTDFWKDSDGDGYGDFLQKMTAADQPIGFVKNHDDCDDSNPNVHPNAAEICGNGIDEDCDGSDLADSQPPTALCKTTSKLVLQADGSAHLPLEFVNDGSVDNCTASLSFSLSRADFSCADLGFQTIELNVVDAAGNASGCSTVVQISDETPPEIFCKTSLTLPLDASGATQLSPSDLLISKSDNCSIQSLSLDKTSFSCLDLGQKQVFLNAADPSGNVSGCSVFVETIDQTPPVLNCVGNDTIFLDDQTGMASVSTSDFILSASDACGPLSFSLSQSQFSTDDLGEKTVVLTATDAAGNPSTCSILILIRQTIAASEPSVGGWKIFPNPISDHLFIEKMDGEIGTARLQIFDALGRVFFEKSLFENLEIETSDWPSGLFWLKIETENERNIEYRTLIAE